MSTLIIKLNATGDVVRTTPLLRAIPGPVTWITAARNLPLLRGVSFAPTCLSWEQRCEALDTKYELLVNLEDEPEVAVFSNLVAHERRFGALLDRRGEMSYTDDSCGWFDLSLISRYGRARADQLKLLNRRTYQELLFDGLGMEFCDQRYVLPEPVCTGLSGDVAIASATGPVWPMKHWAYYEDLKTDLEARGLTVNVLPHRSSILEHLGDIRDHRCVIGGDSLPMHLALGLGVPCVAIFNCTSPWEIHDYGLLTKVVSPLLEEYFYDRGHHFRVMSSIPLEVVRDSVLSALDD